MQWLQGCRGTATPQMGILSPKSSRFQQSFVIILACCVGPTPIIDVNRKTVSIFQDDLLTRGLKNLVEE